MIKTHAINVNGCLYIGDLCYALKDDVYYGVWGGKGNFKDGAYKADNGLEFAMVGTAYGDGCYLGSDGCDYPVDAGIIGICDSKLAKKEGASNLGRFVRGIRGKVTITYNDGEIIVEHNEHRLVSIDTN